MLTQAPKGTNDILPSEVYKWQYIERHAAKVCRSFGYGEIRIPVFEHTELFQRGVGETTDIVQKEMYTFHDKSGRSLTLRPEGTAGVVRSYIEHGMASQPQPVKLYYNITSYRYENVQKGRYREFHQFGAEIFGAAGAEADVELISMLFTLFRKLDLKDISLSINSIGCPACRNAYDSKLRGFLEGVRDGLCKVCLDRLERNPLRVIDCKEESCKQLTKDAPAMADNLCNECAAHFGDLQILLANLGIPFNIDKTIVRGLDYYTKTVFEFISENVGTQKTICGGGRYDGLIEACGGPPVPGAGFALGMERLLLEMESQQAVIPPVEGADVYFATVGEKAGLYAASLVNKLRSEGITAEKDLMGKSLKAQMKYADKINAAYTVVLGDEEMDSNRAVLRNMKTGEQKDVSLDSIYDRLVRNK